MVSAILRENKLDRGHYVEPFAGGGGLALSLLYKGDVGEIHLGSRLIKLDPQPDRSQFDHRHEVA